uniref:Uncharacterized protein n=1 Tax=Peronospora matthiolae TaxID=2874970 RepID=A0AAV1UTY7_9STRA
MLMIGNGSEDEESKEGSDDRPTPKLAWIDEDGVRAEAVLDYAVNTGEDADLPTTYAQAIACDEAEIWHKAMNAKLRSHEHSQTWTLKPQSVSDRTFGSRLVFSKKRD